MLCPQWAPWLFAAALGASACATDGTAPPSTTTDATAGDATDVSSAPWTGPLQVDVQDRAVTLRWDEDEFLSHCLVLRQQKPGAAKPVEVILCPKKKAAQTTVTIGDGQAAEADFPWTAVSGFKAGPATWELRGGDQLGWATTPVSSGSLTLGPHFNGPCVSTNAKATGLQEWHAKAPVKLDVSVKLGVAVRKTVDVSTPEIWVDSVETQGSTAAGGTLQFSYTFDTPGMYTVEVNDLGGGAVLNCAVYVGAAVPLVPVEVGGGLGLAAPPSADQLKVMRVKLLKLVNAERATVGLGPLQLNDKLNEIAQYHSDNMSKLDFFGHTDPMGMGPGERAKEFGFTDPIGENIAMDSSVEGAHNGLFWSAAHRSNMLGKTWGRVGFGFAKSAKDKSILVTENFSTP
jgi:hypothetical protein